MLLLKLQHVCVNIEYGAVVLVLLLMLCVVVLILLMLLVFQYCC